MQQVKMNAFTLIEKTISYINKQFWHINKYIEIVKYLCYNCLNILLREEIVKWQNI